MGDVNHIGVDPGAKGHIVAMEWDTSIRGIWPIHGLTLSELDDLIRGIQRDQLSSVTIEEVSAGGTHTGGTKRKMGAQSAFTFGQGYGELRGLLTAYCPCPVKTIRPQDWRRAAKVPIGSGKPGSLARARELWPERTWSLTGHGPEAGFDAALITYAGKRIYDLTAR